jgi:hypothetical protein
VEIEPLAFLSTDTYLPAPVEMVGESSSGANKGNKRFPTFLFLRRHLALILFCFTAKSRWYFC